MNTMRVGDRVRATYDFQPHDHMWRTEFYIWGEAIERWKTEGLPEDYNEQNLFNYDPPNAHVGAGVDMGWCEPPFIPVFEERQVEDLGDIEIIQDWAGRWLKVFKGRRHGFMPEYIKHPVTNMADWEKVAPRLDPNNPERWKNVPETVRASRARADEVGGMLIANMVGGYMYLRALIGPEDLLYAVYDQPELIHAAMQGWLAVMDESVRGIQAEVEIDEIFMAEDICYKGGILISPDSMREFLLPYYQQVLTNAKSRQKRKIYYRIDTDGDCKPVIPIYSELGLDAMSPMEVASGCDVVEIAKQYPNLIMSGGIDKRILAAGKDAIEAHLQHIMPFMLDRGGYWPTCDHGVPDDVSFENYLYYRRRICEMDHR
jgi:hypothetical protein